MDNITHTLIGVTLARSFRKKEDTSATARAVFWGSVVASNIADLDFVARWLPATGSGAAKLSYLLHHRGWTHTLLFAPLVAALSAGLALILTRAPRNRRTLLEVLGVSVLALLLHIGADALNEYGVHPLSPFSDRWFYGDTLFILEPIFWLAMLPFAFLDAPGRSARIFWGVVAFALAAAVWGLPVIAWPVALALTLLGLVITAVQWRFRGVWPAWGAVVLGLWAFVVTGAVARGRIEGELSRSAPKEEFTDLVLSPMPGNPFCRRVVAVSLDDQGTYRARVGAHSLWERAFRPESCLMRLSRDPKAKLEHLAPWDEPTLPAQGGLFWYGEFSSEMGLFTELIRSNCRFAAALNFIRVPFWLTGEKGLIVGDVRFDRGKDQGFSGFEISGQEDCPWHWPAWEMPFFRGLQSR